MKKMKKGLKYGLIAGSVVIVGVGTFLVIKAIKKKGASNNEIPVEDPQIVGGESPSAPDVDISTTLATVPKFSNSEAQAQIDKNLSDKTKSAVHLEWMKKNHEGGMYASLKAEADAKGVPYYQKLFYYTNWLLKNKGLI